MVPCSHCSTPNTLDSTFCKRCGTALPEDEILAAKEKLEALISEGNTSFSEGRTDEAMAIAENALSSNSSSISALSLKSLCHERRGELAAALECADQIVDLNPDSELDKIKRNQLRSKLTASVQLATQEPDRRSAMVGAIAAVVLVVCLGIGAAKWAGRGEPQSVVIRQPKADTAPPQIVSQPQNAPNASQMQNSPSPGVQRNVEPVQNPPILRSGGGVLPGASGDQGTVTLGGDPNAPMIPSGPISGQVDHGANDRSVAVPSTKSVVTPGSSTTDDPQPGVVNPEQAQNNDPGKIEISISGGSAPKANLGGGSDIAPSGGVSAMVHVGMERMQMEQYGSAATSFEQAIRSGGDQMVLNQRLGQCYDHLGRKSDAVEAYKRSIAACQAALNGNPSSKDLIQRRLESCQQALKSLQGN